MTGDRSPPLSRRGVSRETEQALRDLESLVRKWTPAINLVAKSTVADIWGRHVVDSAQVFDLAPTDWQHWVDLGSGGGFPGLVVAILAKEHRPEGAITFVESDLRKSVFLREAVRQLGLNVQVRNQRAETLSSLAADVLSARALAPLAGLLNYAVQHLNLGGVAIFPKGAQYETEIATARSGWNFEVDSIPSLSDSKAAILMIRNIQRANPR